MMMWLIVILEKKNKCVKTLDVECYLTDFKKMLPESNLTILSPMHANTGYTTRCSHNGKITLYRKEEIFKVFVHETFHTFGFDWHDDRTLNKRVNNIFPINSDINLNESYCEFWACIMNSLFTSYYICDGNLNDFIIYSEYFIFFERLFSLIQLVKILNFMGLEYKNLYESDNISKQQRKLLFKEKTNIFSYYIIKTLFLFNFSDFLIWCNKNNSNIFSFNKTKDNFDKFYLFIKKNYKSKPFLKSIEQSKNIIRKKNNTIRKTMRMTAIEIE